MDYFFFRKKNIFWVILGIIPRMKYFRKSSSVSFLSLRHPNFMRSFRKSYMPFWRKHVYLLAYWQQWNHRTPFHLKARVQYLKGTRICSTKFLNKWLTFFRGPLNHISDKILNTGQNWVIKTVLTKNPCK